MSVKIDDISLQIEYQSNKASDGIDALANSLKNLKSQLNVKGVEKVATGLSSINEALSGINSSNIEKISKLASALETLYLAKGGLGFTKKDAKGIANVGNALPTQDNPTDMQVKPTEQVESALSRVAKASDEVKSRISMAMVESANKTDILKWKLEEAEAKLQNLVNADPQNVGAIANATERVAKLRAELESMSAPANSTAKNVDKVASATNRLSKASSKAVGPLGKLVASFKRMLMYRILSGIIRAVSRAMKEGIQNLALYSKALNGLDSFNANGVMSNLASQMNYLKNAFATLAIPILSALIPAITTFVNWVITAINAVNQLIASLRGLATFTRAKLVPIDYAEQLDKANKGAKKLKDNLQGFDEINNIKTNDSGGGSPSPSEMFEEVPIKEPDWLKKLKDIFDRAIDQFKKGWNEVWDLLDIGDRIEKLKGYLKSIADTWKEIWNDPAVQEAFWRFFDSFFYNLGRIAASLFSIGLSMAEFIVGGLAQFLQAKKDDIKSYLVDMFNIGADIMNLWGDLFVGIATLFTALGSDAGLKFSQGLWTVMWEVFSNISLLFAKLGRDILNIIVQPLRDNAAELEKILEDILNFLGDITLSISDTFDQVGNAIQTVYDEHAKPFLDGIAQTYSDCTAVFIEKWNTELKPVLDEMGQSFVLMNESFITPALVSIVEAFGPLIDIIKLLWESVVDPFFKLVTGYYIPFLMGKINNLVSFTMAEISVFAAALDGIFSSLKIFFQFVVDMCTVGVPQAVINLKNSMYDNAESIRNKWKEVWDFLKSHAIEILSGILNFIVPWVSSVLSYIGQIASALNGVKSAVGGLPSGSGSGPTKRANGGTVETGQLFIAREAGPELVGSMGGTTAVANNDQIVAGIQGGVESAISNMLAPYLASLVASNNEIASKDLSIDGDRLSNAVRQSARNFYKQNGTGMFEFG